MATKSDVLFGITFVVKCELIFLPVSLYDKDIGSNTLKNGSVDNQVAISL
jgi:hypothetical protein